MKIRGRSLFVCLGLLCLPAAYGQQYTIGTLAGNGSAAYTGDGGAAASAQLNSPSAVALGSDGRIYIADTFNHCVRIIQGGTITTFAGTCGTAGYSGDKASATAAKLSAPSGLALDSSGALYIADTGNHVIRKVSGGTITTVAGDNGNPGFGGPGGDGGAATSANLYGPTAVALDAAGNLYIADTGNSVVRKVDLKTGIITAYLGSGATDKRLANPNGLWFDATGTLYIANSNFQSIARYVAPTLTLFAGNQVAGFAGDGGQARTAQFNKPSGVVVDSAGNVYVADTNNSRIRKITTDGVITTVAGKGGGSYSGDGGNATDAFLNFPRSIAVASDGTVYIADTNNHAVRVLTPSFPAIGGVSNAASGVQRISPGALASVYGNGFGANFLADDGFNWPTAPKGVSVKVNGVAAPIYYVSPGQINFQVPWATPTSGTASIAVTYNGGSSNVVSVPVSTAAPGLFVQSNGDAIVQNAPSYSLNADGNPAPAGSTIVAYATGSGPVSPAAKDGVPTPGGTFTIATTSATAKIGTIDAKVDFTGLAPNFIGLVQMNIVVPPLAPGIYLLTVTIDGQTSNSANIAVK